MTDKKYTKDNPCEFRQLFHTCSLSDGGNIIADMADTYPEPKPGDIMSIYTDDDVYKLVRCVEYYEHVFPDGESHVASIAYEDLNK